MHAAFERRKCESDIVSKKSKQDLKMCFCFSLCKVYSISKNVVPKMWLFWVKTVNPKMSIFIEDVVKELHFGFLIVSSWQTEKFGRITFSLGVLIIKKTQLRKHKKDFVFVFICVCVCAVHVNFYECKCCGGKVAKGQTKQQKT